jgi:hypothetical protein
LGRALRPTRGHTAKVKDNRKNRKQLNLKHGSLNICAILGEFKLQKKALYMGLKLKKYIKP